MNVRVTDQNRQKMTEKSEFREMRSFDLAIRRAYFKAQIRRNYAKNVVINRSAYPISGPNYLIDQYPSEVSLYPPHS